MKHLTLIILVLSSLAVSAQIKSSKLYTVKMDSLFNLIEAEEQGMGNIALLKNGEQIYTRAYGYKDLDKKKKSDTESIYRIGSISKTFTATLIMLAAEEGLLAFDTKLSEYYPQFEKSDSITIEHLLRHRSGLYNFTNSPEYPLYMNQKIDKKELLEILQKGGSTFSPDEKFEYSNTGYVLLSFILEDVYKKSYPTILQEKIILPLQLERTFFGDSITSNNNEAYSYVKISNWNKVPETYLGIPLGAGGISSTASETSLFFHALFSGKIVSKPSLKKMREMKDGYGYGLFTLSFKENKSVGHNGGIDGFQSISTYFPDEQLSVTILNNAVKYPINNIWNDVLSIYFDIPFNMPEFNEEIILTVDQLQPYVGVYSSSDFPLKITVALDSIQLMAQATGQSAFPLSAESINTFNFDAAGIKISFDSINHTMELQQMGKTHLFKKE